MYNPDKRTLAVRTFAARLEAAHAELAQDLVKEVHMAHRQAVSSHVPEAARLLRCFETDDSFPFHPRLRTGARRALGSVAIQLSGGAPLTGMARALGAAFVAGNRQVVVNLPPGASRLTSRLAHLADDLLPGVIFTAEVPDAFLMRSLTDAFTRAVWWSGTPDMVLPYGALIRDTRTRFVLEAPGNDPAVIGPHADVAAAAAAVVASAFRHGGRDPASIGRVYVDPAVYEAAVAAICDAAEGLNVAPLEEPDADVSRLSSEAARLALLDWMDAAEDAEASLDIGQDFQYDNDRGRGIPILYPTVVSDCAPHLELVRQRKDGPVLPIVPLEEGEDQLATIVEGGPACAVSCFGVEPALRDALARRCAHLFEGATDASPGSARARHHWGGAPGFMVDHDGTVHTGTVSLCEAFSTDRPTRGDRVSRPSAAPASVA